MTETKPLAVVTGASSGIGFELAKVFADNGFDLLVNAEDGGLDAAGERLRATGAHVQSVQATSVATTGSSSSTPRSPRPDGR
jgi:NAD(P)-dependent dehydrogenase (short-subunit alcohol dehydrogenase family)